MSRDSHFSVRRTDLLVGVMCIASDITPGTARASPCCNRFLTPLQQTKALLLTSVQLQFHVLSRMKTTLILSFQKLFSELHPCSLHTVLQVS